MNNDELIAAGHELAKCLDNEPLIDIAKMIVRLADKLDVTTLALREKTKQCEQVAQAVGWVDGGNFTLAEAVAGHVSGLKAATQRSEELAAENAAIKALNDCLSEELREYESDGAFEGPKMHLLWWKTETPATDAFLAEQRAQGVEMLSKRRRAAAEIARNNNDEMAWVSLEFEAARAEQFAAELRKGGAA
ncbi:hypothetical protein [Cronobacter dublinensis]|uniref:hypothetical protein n=1 Tax=Cronobacter dublinensis TaxID=413497 RepID=UPI00300DBFA0